MNCPRKYAGILDLIGFGSLSRGGNSSVFLTEVRGRMEKALQDRLPGGRFTAVSSKRSRIMKAIRATGNASTEVRFRFALVRAGVSGWRLHAIELPGRPDIIFPEKRVTVFLDGCFWHGCPACGHIPKSNTLFWTAKIDSTKQRDYRNTRRLSGLGYQVLRFWEHELKNDLGACVERLLKRL